MISHMATDIPEITFNTPKEFEKWLSKNHKTIPGVWTKFAKKGSGVTTLTYDEALEIALCYGWIDGLVHGLDDKFYLQKWTPRRPRGAWSARNTGIVEKLIKEGRMKEAGMLEVEKAKADGRWDNAYGSSANMAPPPDFLDALSKNKKALEFWEKINKTNKYGIVWQIQNAKKEETRIRRIEKFVTMMEHGEKLY